VVFSNKRYLTLYYILVNEHENPAAITIRTVVRPRNQLSLTPDELKEEITRILTADDPNVPRNISKFNYRDRCFKLDPPGHSDHMAVHTALEGCLLHVDSHEYHKQEEREKKKEEDTASRMTLHKQSGILASSLPEKHKNLFNYSERSSQTINHPLRSRGVSTEQPPVTQYSANVSVWQIYDSYVSDLMIMNMEHQDGGSVEKRKISFEDRMAVVQGENVNAPKDIVNSDDMCKAIKITERLINQNSQDEIYHDFKYFEDASDEYRAREGSLLPLWKFATQRVKKGQQVTALCWNTYHDDLFAVGFGSYDFLQQGSGNVACYSLKNTSTPEVFFTTESSVLCLDFNVRHPSLLAIGCYDGNVFVYNICSKNPNPIFSSSIRTGSHNDPIWEIHWEKKDNGAELNFYSISSDGKVSSWTLSRNELRMELVMNLTLGQSGKAEPEDSPLVGFACGSCFDFHKKQSHLFVVGTEEGHIYKCSKSYSGQYLQTFTGHHMAVYTVQWNIYHERVFLSCSADWTVKVRIRSMKVNIRCLLLSSVMIVKHPLHIIFSLSLSLFLLLTYSIIALGSK